MASTLLFYAPVPVFRQDGKLFLERQACNGLRLWARNFDRVLVMMPEESGAVPENWAPIEAIGPELERIEVHTLPTAYRPDQFARAFGAGRRTIRSLIARADYLSFAIGGLFGDWGSVACIQAHQMKRPYAVWTDRVESQVMRREADSGSWKHRLKARVYWRPMAALEHHVIRRATLGLFHGRDTFDTYAPHCAKPVLVHDIHLSKADHIAADTLQQKLRTVATGPLKLVYAGRAEAMKGPFDWIEVLATLDAQGLDFHATWLGDGDLLSAMRLEVDNRRLNDKISLPGFTQDRAELLDQLRHAHVFLFCHKTPESPRCLIEALISGCPIVGYRAAYPVDLIAGHGGGHLTPIDDPTALAAAVTDLAKDRSRLGTMIANAARDGAPFDDETVFRHRSDAIKANL